MKWKWERKLDIRFFPTFYLSKKSKYEDKNKWLYTRQNYLRIVWKRKVFFFIIIFLFHFIVLNWIKLFCNCFEFDYLYKGVIGMGGKCFPLIFFLKKILLFIQVNFYCIKIDRLLLSSSFIKLLNYWFRNFIRIWVAGIWNLSRPDITLSLGWTPWS